MIKKFCKNDDKSEVLHCLKLSKDIDMFDDKCKNFVVNRMIEQNTDYRFNPDLQASCSLDYKRHCKHVCI